jgi:hypothetical protein
MRKRLTIWLLSIVISRVHGYEFEDYATYTCEVHALERMKEARSFLEVSA